VQIGLTDLKMVISISVTKNTPDTTAVEEDETFLLSFNQFRDITSILQRASQHCFSLSSNRFCF